MFELFSLEFMRNALIAAVLVGVACGVVGTYVVVKRIVFISGGITHAAFGGIGLGFLLGINPLLTAIPFAVGSALLVALVSRKVKISEDSAIGMLWTIGMALGVLFIFLAPGYAPDLFSYLFGSILTVPTTDLWFMFALDIAILFTALLFHKEFQAISFDPEYAQLRGVPVQLFEMLLYFLVALSVVVLIRVVGVILVIALLTIPTVISRQYFSRLKPIMFSSAVLAILMTILGLLISFRANLPAGATIVLLLAFAFLLTSAWNKLASR
jgi:zinc transport system permease protein